MKLIFSYLSTMPTNLFTLFFFIFFTLIKQGEAANYYPVDEKSVIDLCQFDSINSVDSISQSTYLWESSLRPVAELDAQGNILARYVYGNRINVPEYMQKNGATYRFITDRLGSVRQLVNIHTGEIAQKLSYITFGQVIENTNPDFQPFGFAGGIYDRHTGLVRFGARDYDAHLGRWTDKEPLGFNAEMNFYRYAYNDPVNLVDVDGNFGVIPAIMLAIKVYDVITTAQDVKQAYNDVNNPCLSFGEKVKSVANAAVGLLPGGGAAKKAGKSLGAAEKGILPKVPTGPGAVPKSQRDPVRNFKPSDRAEKRAQQGHACANGCGTKIDQVNSHGHHIKRHADGGGTNSENHAEVCIDCHLDIHSGR